MTSINHAGEQSADGFTESQRQNAKAAHLRQLGEWCFDRQGDVEAVECLGVLLALQLQHTQRIRRLQGHSSDTIDAVT